MDIRYLQYFLIIAEKQSISAAAREIFIEQSSLSKIISKLEEHYKTTLFARTPHGVKLTENGEILLEYAKTMISTYRESLLKISRDHLSKLAVYYCSGLERWLIPAALNTFQQENPLTALDLHCCSWQDMSILHTLSEPDIIISFAFAVKILPVMEKVTLMYDPMVLVVSPTHPLAGREYVTQEEIASLKFTFVASTAMESTVSMFQESGIKFNVTKTSNTSTANTLIMSGLYASIRSKSDHLENPQFSHVPIKDLPETELVALHGKNVPNRDVQPFLRCLKNALREFHIK